MRAGQKACSAFQKCEMELQPKTLITSEAESANFMNSALWGWLIKFNLKIFESLMGELAHCKASNKRHNYKT